MVFVPEGMLAALVEPLGAAFDGVAGVARRAQTGTAGSLESKSGGKE